MKKFGFSLVAILLVGIFALSGCTKASTANLETASALFDGIVAKYQSREDVNKYKIFDSSEQIDLYSQDSYEADIFAVIDSVETDGSMHNLNTLKEGAEYQTLMHAVSQLYLKWKNVSYTTEIPQETMTKLYQEIDEMKTYIEDLYVSKLGIHTTFKSFENPDSVPMKESLTRFLTYYAKLINNFYNISLAYEAVYETVFPTKTVIQLRYGDLIKFVLSSELYLAKYYYLKNIVLTGEYLTRFSYESIYDYNEESFVSNSNYDKTFADFVEICAKDNIMGELSDSDLTNADKIHYYNVGIKKMESLKTGIQNFEIAVEKIKNNQDSNGEYAKYVEDFAEQVASYQEYVLNNIIG